MALLGHIDVASEFTLHGWAYDDASPDQAVSVEILINGVAAGTVRASYFRPDLLGAGMGDGRKGFWFNPFEYLTRVENEVSVRVAGTEHFLYSARRVIPAWPVPAERGESAMRNVEKNGALPGHEFMNFVDELYSTGLQTEVLEIDPGEGQVLLAMMERNKWFAHYLGVDISRERTEKLHAQFDWPKIQFRAGDGGTYPYSQTFHMVLASGTFDRHYPSFAAALGNISRCVREGGMVFVDLVAEDEELLTSRAYFGPSGEFTRVYSEKELGRFFEDAGMEIVKLAPGRAGAVLRTMVGAVKR